MNKQGLKTVAVVAQRKGRTVKEIAEFCDATIKEVEKVLSEYKKEKSK
jgi:hypothetical protein